jgi:activating signal cointegrator complex subunit 2
MLIGIQFVYHRQDESTVLRDKTFMEEMKADILRRAEAISDEEEEEDDDALEFGGGKTKSMVLAYDDEDLDGASNVKIGGDGDESEDGEEDEEREGAVVQKAQTPETILELAYLRDPRLFDRDAGTRRSKGREELKAQTGMCCFIFISSHNLSTSD